MTKIKRRHIIQLNTTQAEYTIQEQGEYLIVPVVMMTEGVRSGSQGPVLHLEQYYSQQPEAWDGAPVTAGHPETHDGQQVPVNQVSSDQWIVGYLQNTRVEDGKLKSEAKIHRQRAIAVNPEVINYLSEGRRLDVSIGAFTQDVPEEGKYQNNEYSAVTVMYQPDHLALLPGERGACSWSDGCGIRTNKESQQNEDSNEMKNKFKALKEDLREGKGVINSLQDNQAGFMDFSRQIQSQLDRMDSEIRIHFLTEIFTEDFIYKVRNTDTGDQRWYRQEYSVNEDDEVAFQGPPQEVNRQVEFVPVQNNQKIQDNDEDCGCGGMTRTKYNTNTKNEDTMSKEKDKGAPSGEVMEKVVGLINNERTRFAKSDRSWLLNLNSDQLDTLEPTEAPEPEITEEQAVQALSETLADVDKLTEIVPDDVSNKIETGLSAYNDIREKLIKSIQTNTSEEDWPTETLEEMGTENLKRLNKSVKPTDYSGQGPVTTNTKATGTGEVQPMYPVGVEIKE